MVHSCWFYVPPQQKVSTAVQDLGLQHSANNCVYVCMSIQTDEELEDKNWMSSFVFQGTIWITRNGLGRSKT